MDREELEGYLEQGLSLAQIGQRVGKHESTVGYWLKRHGLNAVNRGKHAPRGGLDRATLETFVARGLSMRAMARELDVSLATVRHWMTRHRLTATAYVRSNPLVTKPPELQRYCRRHGQTSFVLTSQGGYRCKRCRTAAVSARRRRVKQILVDEAGGSCALCGYDRCVGALQFHHVDPSTKSFTLSHGGVTASIARAREEAAKCILLCSNCHAEVESGRAGVALPRAS